MAASRLTGPRVDPVGEFSRETGFFSATDENLTDISTDYRISFERDQS